MRNRLTALRRLQPATFQYDAFGRRISRSTAAGTTEYLYDGAVPTHYTWGAFGATSATGEASDNA